MRIRLWTVAAAAAAIALLSAAVVSAQDTPVLAGTQWQLASLGTPENPTPAVEGSTVTLEFLDESQAGGSAGCNNYGSTYTVDGDSITFSMPFSTMMMCVDPDIMAQEQAFLAALSTVTSFAIDGNTLTLTYGGGEQLVFNQVTPLSGTQWSLVSLGAADSPTPVIDGTTVTMAFGADGFVSGTGGCNRYGSSYVVDGDSITFGMGFSTMMACPEDIMQQESDFLAALQEATTFTIDGGTLTISYGEGNALVLTEVSQLINTAWVLDSFGTSNSRTAAAEGTTITLAFGEDDDAFGSAGCNNYNTSVTIEGSAITFGMPMTTRMMCEEATMTQETDYLTTLQAVTSYEVAPDLLKLITPDGQELWFIPAAMAEAMAS